MLPETEKRVHSLRGGTNAARAKLTEAKTLLGNNDDEYMRGLIQQATHWLNDVEDHFIAVLTLHTSPPRTLAEESMIVSQAEFHLSQITLPLIKSVHETATKYGANLKSIG
jgi:hypothetical protein